MLRSLQYYYLLHFYSLRQAKLITAMFTCDANTRKTGQSQDVLQNETPSSKLLREVWKRERLRILLALMFLLSLSPKPQFNTD